MLKNHRSARLAAIISVFFVVAITASMVSAQDKKSDSRITSETPVLSSELPQYSAVRPEVPYVTKPSSVSSFSPLAVNTYAPTRTTGITYTSIAGTGTSVSTWRNGTSLDDNMSNSQPIGFTFIYNGGAYQNFLVSTNGFITFNTATTAVGSGTGAYGHPNANISTAATCTCNALAPMYDDLTVPTAGSLTGNIKYQTTGVAPNRILTVEWIGMELFANAGPDMNFQVKLYEIDGHIEYVYGTMNSGTTGTYSYSSGLNASSVSAVPAVAELLTQQTANTATFSNTAQNSLGGANPGAAVPATNTQITFTPPVTVPAAATGLTFPTVGSSFAALNWTDNATDEINYNILISTDGGVTYSTFGAVLAANTTGVTITGLLPSTTYFFRVLACTEGVCSAPLDNSVATGAPISGTKTIGPGGDYPSFSLAISDVNSALGGPVTFNVAAGLTFAENGTCITGGTVTNTVLFQKNGAGANPIIQPPGSASTQDSGICILGGDYVTFDGIDVQVAAANTLVEFGALVFNLSATNGATNNTIKNTRIVLNRGNLSSVGIIQTLSVAATAGSGANSNNKYHNFAIENVNRGILLNSTTATFPDANNEIGTTFGGTSVVGAAVADDICNSTATCFGINAVSQNAVKIFNTTVQNVTGTSTNAYSGIYLNNGAAGTFGTSLVFNNKVQNISRITSTTNTATVYGIRADLSTGNTATVYNNFVTGLNYSNPATATATTLIRGLAVNVGGNAGTVNSFFNSVRVDHSASLNASSASYYVAGGTSTTRNNIFSNFTAAQTGTPKHWVYYRSTGTITSSNNDLYVGSGTTATNGFTGFFTTDQATLANWQAAQAGLDTASIAADPLFVSATDLHVAGGSPVVDAGVAAGGITQDIDGQNRVGNPDIGADEPGGVTPPANDLSATAFIDPANGGLKITNASFAPQASFTNNGTSAQTGVTVRFRICTDGTCTTEVYNQTATISSIAPLATVNVTFPSSSIATPGAYTMKARSELGTDTVPANDEITGAFSVQAPLAGTYTVGTAGTYTTLTSAINALNGVGVSGPVTISLLDSTYPAETFPITINQFPGASATNRVTIKPAPGISPTISGSSATCVINLNGADYVTIDGSNAVGGTTRDLTVTNTSTAGGSAVVCVTSLGTGLGATFDTVSNTNIAAGTNQATGTTLSFGIFSGGSGTPSITLDGVDNDDNTFSNNFVTSARYGIFVRGGVIATNPNDRVNISQNLIGPAAFGSTEIGRNGIAIQAQNLATVTQNEVRFVGGDFANRSTFGKAIGIAVGSETGPAATRTVITNSSITRNLIHDVEDERTGSAIGIMVGEDATVATNNIVANNMIYNVLANGTVGDHAAGIAIDGGNGDSVVHNSILMTGDIDHSVGATAATQSAVGMRIVSTTPVNLRLMNNISSVDITSNTATLKHYAFVKPSATYSFGTGGSNYNDYFVNATNAQMVLFGNGTAVPYTDVTTLSAWQGETPAHDANSQVNDPKFLSPTDLHLDVVLTPLLGDGTLIAGVNNDFDNDLRDSLPEIGADENVAGRTGTIPAGTYRDANLGAGTLAGNVTLTGNLTLSGIIDGAAAMLSLGCNTTVTGAGPSSYVVGTINKDYCGPALFSYPVGDNGWTPVTADVTAGGTFPSSLSVKSFDAFLTGFDTTQSLSRNWALLETGSVVANLSFTYLPADVNGTEANYRVWRRDENGILSDMCGAPCNAGAPTLGPVNGVSVFSRWTGSENLAPTAAGVDVSGRVLVPGGGGLRNAIVTLTDSRGVTRTSRSTTFGNYKFEGVRVGETYVLAVNSKRYSFTPRTVQVLDEVTELDMTAEEER